VAEPEHSFDIAAAHNYRAARTTPQRSSEQITAVVGAWPGVTWEIGGRGEIAFHVGRREVGHLHGDGAAHFGFPRHVWIALHKQGRIEPHPVFSHLVGPAARRIGTLEDVQAVIDLFRVNYERLMTFRRPSTPARETP